MNLFVDICCCISQRQTRASLDHDGAEWSTSHYLLDYNIHIQLSTVYTDSNSDHCHISHMAD